MQKHPENSPHKMSPGQSWGRLSPEARLTFLTARALAATADSALMGELLSAVRLDWQKFNRLVLYHEIFPAAGVYLKNFPAQVPAAELKILENNFGIIQGRLRRLREETLCVWEEFRKNNLQVLTLKGAYFLTDPFVYGPEAYLRPMRDIDLLIKKEELNKAAAVLAALGYAKELHGFKESYWLQKSYHLAFARRFPDGQSVVVELHWELDYPGNRALLTRLWQRLPSGRQDIPPSLSPEDSLFSLALHQRRFGKMLLLKSAVDTARLLTKNKERMDWAYLLEEAFRAKTRTTLYFTLEQARLLFGVITPQAVLKKLQVPRYKQGWIRDFILKNTFLEEPDLKALYLKAHFLLYDNFTKPAAAVLSVPREQFAKFYGLPAYTLKTGILYRLRWFYFAGQTLRELFKAPEK